MAAAREARKLVCLDRREKRWVCGMHRTFLKRTGARMTMQALPIVVRLIQLDVRRLGRLSQVVDVEMAQAADLGLDTAEHRVIGMAGVTSLAGRHSVILIVGSCQMRRIV